MRLIIKGKEPVEWKAERETPDRGEFDSIPELRKSLYIDQGGICAYCMKRLEDELTPIKDRKIKVVGAHEVIKRDAESKKDKIIIEESHEIVKNKVEHIITQAKSKNLGNLDNDFNYGNMLLCCCGKTVYEKKLHVHCDTLRLNTELTLSPLDNDFIKMLSYDNSGEMKTGNKVWDNEIETVLNLNCTVLKSNRKSVITAIRSKLTGYNKRTKKTKNISWNPKYFERELFNWNDRDENDLFKPYCGIVTWYLQKKLNQAVK